MKKKKLSNKLTLRKSTVSNLHDIELKIAKGGNRETRVGPDCRVTRFKFSCFEGEECYSIFCSVAYTCMCD